MLNLVKPRFATFLNALSLNSSGRTFAHWAVATCGIYELGGILFVMGSVLVAGISWAWRFLFPQRLRNGIFHGQFPNPSKHVSAFQDRLNI